MRKEKHDEVMVGAFVVIGFIFLTLAVFFISGVYIFRSGYALNVMYEYVSILDKGAPVRMAGVRIGEISKVSLVYDQKLKKTRVEVKLFIEKKVKIKENYLFTIRGTHILSEPHIEISPQSGDAPVLKPDAVIEGVNPVPLEDLIKRADVIAGDLEAIMDHFKDAVMDEQVSKSLKELITNMATITHSLSIAMNGSEQDMKQTIKDIHASTESLSAILDKVQKGDGTVGQLLTKDELYQDMRSFVQEIKTHPWRLMKSDKDRRKFLWIF